VKPARQGKVERRLKTVSAYREVDLHPDAAKLLNEFIGTRTSGFLFQASNGKPLTLTNITSSPLASGAEGAWIC